MKNRIMQNVFIAIALSVIVIVTLGFVSLGFVRAMIQAVQQNNQSHQLLLAADRTRLMLVELRFEMSRVNPAISKDLSENIGLLKDNINVLDSLEVKGFSRSRINGLNLALEKVIQSVEGHQQDSLEGFAAVIQQLQQLHDDEKQTRKLRLSALTNHYYNFVATALALFFVWMVIKGVLIFTLLKSLKARDRVEESLRLASLENRDLYENAPCGYFTVNGDGMIVSMNQTMLRWLRYTQVAVVDRLHLKDLLSTEDQSYADLILQSGADTLAGDLETEMIREDASRLSVALQYTQHSDAKRQKLVRCSAVDNTRRKKAEIEIRQANKELEAFSYSVSHDLRAPLRSINGYAQILLEDYGNRIDGEGTKVINIIVNNGKKMGQLIDDLLAFSQTGRKDMIHASIRMDDWVKNLAQELVEHEKGRQIDLTIHPLEKAIGDVSLMRQVWINLLSNAIKYTRQRPVATIEIGCKTGEDETTYYIKDNGAGFNMDYYPKLFGVFQRLHKDEDFEGTGVGLALVKRIIERHRGKIWAEAKLHEGATFYFSIPLKQAPNSEMV